MDIESNQYRKYNGIVHAATSLKLGRTLGVDDGGGCYSVSSGNQRCDVT